MSASRPHSTQELTQAVRDAVKMQHYTPLNDALARIEEQYEIVLANCKELNESNFAHIAEKESLREQLETARAFAQQVLDGDRYGCENGPMACLHWDAKKQLELLGSNPASEPKED